MNEIKTMKLSELKILQEMPRDKFQDDDEFAGHDGKGWFL